MRRGLSPSKTPSPSSFVGFPPGDPGNGDPCQDDEELRNESTDEKERQIEDEDVGDEEQARALRFQTKRPKTMWYR